MRTTVGQLRKLFQQGMQEAKISAAPGYLKKEAVREAVQEILVKAVKEGNIIDQKSLEDFFGDLDMSVKALKMVPFDVWKTRMETPKSRKT